MKIRLLILLIVLGSAIYAQRVKQNSPHSPASYRTHASQSTPVSIEPPVEIDLDALTIIEARSTYPYLAMFPKQYGIDAKFWPAIVFLHGQSNDFGLEKLRWHGPIPYGARRPDFPFIVIAPSSGDGWNIAKLEVLLDHAIARYAIDRDRVYLTGLSMGGHATWRWAVYNPNRFAALAVMCGAGDPKAAQAKLKETPVWVFHGMRDDIVPAYHGMKMIGALKAVGAPVKYTLEHEAGHEIYFHAYQRDDLYEWFGRHSRADRRMASSANIGSSTLSL